MPVPHLLATALIALALLLRVAVPAGWMPSGQGTSIMPCPGIASVPASGEHGMHMPGKAGDPQRHDDGQSHECPFAGQAAALDLAHVAEPAPPAAAAEAAALPALPTAAIGHGLAAPPPPPT